MNRLGNIFCVPWPLVAVLIISSIFADAQQNEVKGVVSIVNSKTLTGKRIFVTNAQVIDDFGRAQSTVTDQNGLFTLIYVGVKEKSTVSFHIHAPRLAVVNTEALTAIAGQTDLKQISMADPDSLIAFRLKIYNISKTEALKYLDREAESKNLELKRLRNQQGLNDKYIKKLKDDIIALSDQKSMIEEQATELANRYSAINLDDASPLVFQSFRLFNDGKLDSAQHLLDKANLSERVANILKEEKKTASIKLELKKRDSIVMRRRKELSEALELQVDFFKIQYRFKDVCDTYDLMIKLDSLNVGYYHDYAYFLQYLNRYTNSISLYLKALKIVDLRTTSDNYEMQLMRADIEENLGKVYLAVNDFPKSEQSFLLSLEICRSLSANDPKSFTRVLARVEMQMGHLYDQSKEVEKCEAAYAKALELSTSLLGDGDSSQKEQIALIQNGLGIFYLGQNRNDEAEISLKRSLDLYETLSQLDTNKYQKDLAMIYINIGNLYQRKNVLTNAEIFYKKSLQLLTYLSKTLPETFEPDLLGLENNLGNLCYLENRNDEAEVYYKAALKRCGELANQIPEAYMPKVAKLESNLAVLYRQNGQFQLAEFYYIDALQKDRVLVKRNPRVYEPELASVLGNLGNAYFVQQKFDAAYPCYIEAFNIYNRLAIETPLEFEPFLAIAETNLGGLFLEQQQYRKSEDLLRKSFLLCKKWYDKYPSIYDWDFHNVSVDLIKLYRSVSQSTQSESFKDTCLVNFQAIESPLINRCRIDHGVLLLLRSYYIVRAWNLLTKRKFKEGELNAKKAIEMDSSIVDAFRIDALALLLQGKRKEALRVYKIMKSSIQSQPNNIEICLNQLADLEKRGIFNRYFVDARLLLSQ